MRAQLWTYVVDRTTATQPIELLLRLNNLHFRRFSTAEAFLSEVDVLSQGCVIVNVQPSGINGVQLLETLRTQKSTLSILIHTDAVDVVTAVRWMERGAVTVLRKPCSPETLLAAIRRGSSVSQSRWEHVRRTATVEQSLARLDDEENEILELLLAGKSNKEIAEEMVLSDRTVARRRRNIMEKMHANSLVELCRLLFSTNCSQCTCLTGAAS